MPGSGTTTSRVPEGPRLSGGWAAAGVRLGERDKAGTLRHDESSRGNRVRRRDDAGAHLRAGRRGGGDADRRGAAERGGDGAGVSRADGASTGVGEAHRADPPARRSRGGGGGAGEG